ncbi:hypothetical protein ACFQFC_10185 [Amorphoplanes digitatis]|uniref:Glycosyl hydrolase family 67 C-terminal domain-containing protein n=1 Tax=Actinoplanes digitatis TaxID=1868 RepID=A0A7W7I1K0_9ACTN|nr:hypothetical protein [Actinoplanes digitatis]MBB4764566.1 hypothetical protein [Actinoplanes digitatis]GID91483.1 hypothetical protein Adi01nite_08950 [Actinoplanes digitatis]
MRRIMIIFVLLSLGAGMAFGLSGALRLSWTPADVMTEPSAMAPPLTVTPSPIGAVTVNRHTHRLDVAARAVTDAAKGQDARGVLKVTVGENAADESYRLDLTAAGLTLTAAGEAGGAAGLYALADKIRSGEPLTAGPVTPRLGLRLTDAGSVGRDSAAAGWSKGTDYSLNSDIVTGALLQQAPWVDRAAADRVAAEFRQFIDHSAAQGYNGVVVPGFLEYVTFARVGDGHAVYPAGDPHVARAQAMVREFAPVFRYAADMGMRVYFMTDMLALSGPLDAYLKTQRDPWAVYQSGLRELFASMPFASGLMVRIGEGGSAYRAPGWDYFSRIAVTTPDQVQAMLKAFLAVAGEGDRDVIFRTWTVGVGAVGDLHTNPESYEEVLGKLQDPHLIVSTKFTLGDFYSHLPLNTTLTVGEHRRIVEFQGRREFEGFGSLPNDLTALHASALRRLLAGNGHIEGVWLWTQEGGPLRAGPMTLYLRTGFWQLYDLNAYAMGRLAREPDADPGEITADWVRQTFSSDPATVAAIFRMFASSREAVTKGLYLTPYADNSVKALGLEPPPMMWIFEWDIVTGDSAVLDSIYATGRGHVDETIAEGERAVAVAERQRADVAATDPATWRDPALRAKLLDSLEYQRDLYDTLGAYRAMFLRRAQWLDTGSARAREQWRAAERAYREARDLHVRAHGGDLDLPAYNFTAADLGSERFDRDPAMAVLARILLGLLLASILVPWRPVRNLWRAAIMPWRAPESPTRAARWVAILLPAAALLLSREIHTWFAAPAHLLATLGSWAVFALVARLLVRGRDPYALWTVIGGVALLRTVLLLAVLAVRGPGYYWFQFWTNPAARTAYVIIAFGSFAWLFVATGSVLRARYGRSSRRAAGGVLLAAGAPVLALGVLIWSLGLERSLSAWNDQMALLPWGLHRILGIVTFLGIPPALPVWIAVTGAVLTVAGAGLSVSRRRPAVPRTRPADR